MQTNPATEQNKKTLNGQRIHRVSPVGEEKVYGGNDNKKQQQQRSVIHPLGSRRSRTRSL